MPGSCAALDEPLETLRKAHPDDFSVAIAIALQALASGDSKRIEPALDGLNRLVERTPLEPLPPAAGPTARQRAEAARQIPLWLVARACEKQSSAAMHELADRLAARALEAARRQTDPAPGHAPRAGPACPRTSRPRRPRPPGAGCSRWSWLPSKPKLRRAGQLGPRTPRRDLNPEATRKPAPTSANDDRTRASARVRDRQVRHDPLRDHAVARARLARARLRKGGQYPPVSQELSTSNSEPAMFAHWAGTIVRALSWRRGPWVDRRNPVATCQPTDSRG